MVKRAMVGVEDDESVGRIQQSGYLDIQGVAGSHEAGEVARSLRVNNVRHRSSDAQHPIQYARVSAFRRLIKFRYRLGPAI